MNNNQFAAGRVFGSIRWSALLLLVLTLTGCATGGLVSGEDAIEESLLVKSADLGIDQGEDTAGPSEQNAELQPASFDGAYRIGPGDVLKFMCLNDESLNDRVEVRYDGFISLPLVSDIKAQGLTREEVTKVLLDAYASEFLEPRVSLSIMSANSKSYHVAGDVSRPGEFPYVRPITLIDAINLSGGVRQSQNTGDSSLIGRGQLSKVFVIRHQEGKRDVLSYDLRGIEKTGAHASDAPVYPGDLLYVPQVVNLAYVMGQAKKAGAYRISEGMNLLQLLALAGGPIDATAKLKHILLIREVDSENMKVHFVNAKAILQQGVILPIQPGDIIYLPRKNLVRSSDFVRQLHSTISPNLSLYTQAYDAYYTKDRYDYLKSNSTGANGALLTMEQMLRNMGSIASFATGLP